MAGVKIVVTGASGFLGEAVIRRLRETGETVVPVARRPLPGFVRVTDYADSPGGDVLIHLAEPAGRVIAEDPAAGVLEALLAKGYKRVVYASSAVVYGDEASTPRRTDAELSIADGYARVKRRGELAVLTHGMGAVARLTNLFGPGMSSENVMSTILRQIPGQGALQVRDAAPVRDFIWIDDAADAVTRMALGGHTGIFNVGTGTASSIGSVARLALNLAAEGDRPVISTQPESRQSHLVLDISDTISTWNWTPVTALDTGLAILVSARTARMHE